jgi:hypothetical protein
VHANANLNILNTLARYKSLHPARFYHARVRFRTPHLEPAYPVAQRHPTRKNALLVAGPSEAGLISLCRKLGSQAATRWSPRDRASCYKYADFAFAKDHH